MIEWTPDRVKFELVRAFRVLQSVPVRDSFYTAGGGFWPSYCYEKDEIAEQRAQEATENRPVRDRRRYTPRDIQRMEAILLGQGNEKAWLVRFLNEAPAARRCLTWWAIWAAQDRTIKVACRRKGWAYSTFRRQRDNGACLLAEALNRARVEI